MQGTGKDVHLHILLTLPEPVRLRYRDGLLAAFPELRISIADHHSRVEPDIATADVLLTFAPMMANAVLQKAPRLKWIQALGTGTDGLHDLPSLRPDVLLTSVHGIHGDTMSEAAVMAMLALARKLPRALRNQQQAKWDRGAPSSLLKGKTAAIFGVGAIALVLAPLLRAFGMRVVGISSAPGRRVEGFDEMRASDDLAAAVRDADHLILLTPYSAGTRNAVDARVLGAMKPSAFLVNLARGGVVDEDALLAALRDKRIAGAALDVFTREPLPPDHALWAQENVILTPHLGGFYDTYPDNALPVVIENMRRFLAGRGAEMLNRVARA
jgi:D-2-hydroxyacid dehydrogenase (NADP+)